jgi:hypothetical protein
MTDLVPCPRCQNRKYRFTYCSLCNLDKVVTPELAAAYCMLSKEGDVMSGEQAEELRLTLTDQRLCKHV